MSTSRSCSRRTRRPRRRRPAFRRACAAPTGRSCGSSRTAVRPRSAYCRRPGSMRGGSCRRWLRDIPSESAKRFLRCRIRPSGRSAMSSRRWRRSCRFCVRPSRRLRGVCGPAGRWRPTGRCSPRLRSPRLREACRVPYRDRPFRRSCRLSNNPAPAGPPDSGHRVLST